jgi:DNA-binding CsgD family transcriptional regulator
MASHSIGLFERVAIDAQRVRTIGACRSALLGAVATLLGTDSAALMDPHWGPAVTGGGERIAVLGTSEGYLGPWVENRKRWAHSLRKLLGVARAGPMIDTDVYDARERRRLAIYQEVFHPQGATSILASFVPHGGRSVAMIMFKRHGRGTPFMAHDAQVLSSLLPAIGLADAGFQFAFDATAGPAEEPPPADDLSPREAQVAHLACTGMRNAEIAALLGTSGETVKKQLASAMEKMDVSNRTELAMLWGNISRDRATVALHTRAERPTGGCGPPRPDPPLR